MKNFKVQIDFNRSLVKIPSPTVMRIMMSTLRHLMLFSFLFSILSTPAFTHEIKKSSFINPFLGPEIYYVKRTKEGGAEQTGTLYGVRAGIDHVQRFKFYWAFDFLWATGNLTGKREDVCLKSQLTDTNIECRLGYTFQSKCGGKPSFTPFIGAGYFSEANNYKSPSPLRVHLNNTFSYVPFGFLSHVFIFPNCSIGLNFKVRFLWDGKQRVSNDPYHCSVTQKYEEKLQYRIELPCSYYFCWNCHSLGMKIEPFYEYRSYGHGVNYPFDFMETTFRIYGATLKFLYLF